MRRTTLVMTAALLALASGSSTLRAQPAQAMAPATLLEHSEYIDSFDGTRLAVTVFRPARGGERVEGRFPVIVTQDRGEAGERARTRQFFVDHGYVVVAQDRRGTGASFGTQTGFVTREDLRDAKAVIEWAARQDFSTGAVGAMGCSNQGVWQYGVAALRPAGLKAIAPACASPAFFDDAVSLNGVPMFELRKAPYDATCPDAGGSEPASPARPVDSDVDGAMLREALATRGCTAPMLGQYWLNMPRDGWNAFGVYRPAIEDSPITGWREIRDSGVAILQLGGWFDAAVAGQLLGQSLWGGRVIMGPWVHGNRSPVGATFPAGQLDLNGEMLAWFDRHLKGLATDRPTTGIAYYVVNAAAGEEWRQSSSWSEAGGTPTRYFLHGSALSREAPGTDASQAPLPGEGVRWFDGRYAPLARWWDGDMAGTDRLSLTHTSAPLTHDTEVIGTPVARLWIASDDPDLNLYAVVEDVAPDGRSSYVTDGRLRASWRAVADPPWGATGANWHRGLAQDLRALEPGAPTELVFDLFPIAYRFRAGHRIRLALTTSIGQAYQQPPSAGATLPEAVLLADPQHASAIELPLADAR